MSAESLAPVPPRIGLVIPDTDAPIARPTRPRPIVQHLVERNTHYPSTPYRVYIDVKATTPEQSLAALNRAYAAAQAQLRALIDLDAERAGESQ